MWLQSPNFAVKYVNYTHSILLVSYWTLIITLHCIKYHFNSKPSDYISSLINLLLSKSWSVFRGHSVGRWYILWTNAPYKLICFRKRVFLITFQFNLSLLRLQALVVALEVSMIFIVCARPQDTRILQIDSDSSHMNGNQQHLVKGSIRLRRSTWHPCYEKDNNGNPVMIHTSNNNLEYKCKRATAQACGHVIPKYSYAKCQPITHYTGGVAYVAGCECAS